MERRKILKHLSLLPLAGTMVIGNEVKAEVPERDQWTPKKIAIKSDYSHYARRSPLSTCIRSGHLLFVCGIGGWYPEMRDEPGDIKVQVHSALTIMKEVLENAGSSMANVLKVHMTIAEPNKNLALLNEVYGDFFPEPRPVRSFTGAAVDQMGRDGVLLQIDCTAYVD